MFLGAWAGGGDWGSGAEKEYESGHAPSVPTAQVSPPAKHHEEHVPESPKEPSKKQKETTPAPSKEEKEPPRSPAPVTLEKEPPKTPAPSKEEKEPTRTPAPSTEEKEPPKSPAPAKKKKHCIEPSKSTSEPSPASSKGEEEHHHQPTAEEIATEYVDPCYIDPALGREFEEPKTTGSVEVVPAPFVKARTTIPEPDPVAEGIVSEATTSSYGSGYKPYSQRSSHGDVPIPTVQTGSWSMDYTSSPYYDATLGAYDSSYHEIYSYGKSPGDSGSSASYHDYGSGDHYYDMSKSATDYYSGRDDDHGGHHG